MWQTFRSELLRFGYDLQRIERDCSLLRMESRKVLIRPERHNIVPKMEPILPEWDCVHAPATMQK